MRNLCFTLCILFAATGHAFSEDSPPRLISYGYDHQQLAEADSLFHSGSYEAARALYLKIRDMKTNSSVPADAQFSLAYTYIYYDNPYADFDLALREFKTFATLYPTNGKIDQAYSWIRILTAMQDFSEGFNSSASKFKAIQQKQTGVVKNYTSLQEAYNTGESQRDSLKEVCDSLKNSVRILESVIDKLGKLK